MVTPKPVHTIPSIESSLNSTLVSRNITINGRRTSVRLEPDMWNGLRDICRREHATMHAICSAVAERKPENTSLTAAIRVFVMAYYRAAATEDGHNRAGHGPGGTVFITPTKQPDENKMLARTSFLSKPHLITEAYRNVSY